MSVAAAACQLRRISVMSSLPQKKKKQRKQKEAQGQDYYIPNIQQEMEKQLRDAGLLDEPEQQGSSSSSGRAVAAVGSASEEQQDRGAEVQAADVVDQVEQAVTDAGSGGEVPGHNLPTDPDQPDERATTTGETTGHRMDVRARLYWQRALTKVRARARKAREPPAREAPPIPDSPVDANGSGGGDGDGVVGRTGTVFGAPASPSPPRWTPELREKSKRVLLPKKPNTLPRRLRRPKWTPALRLKAKITPLPHRLADPNFVPRGPPVVQQTGGSSSSAGHAQPEEPAGCTSKAVALAKPKWTLLRPQKRKR